MDILSKNKVAAPISSNLKFTVITKTIYFKTNTQMWNLQSFISPLSFWFAAIYTWIPTFKIIMFTCEIYIPQQWNRIRVHHIYLRHLQVYSLKVEADQSFLPVTPCMFMLLTKELDYYRFNHILMKFMLLCLTKQASQS